ncbi:helix-turn-helix domain-containing protein [Glaciimonas immobilis]|uniref:AraC-like DNA-binding protein n=1 Tax=Glaciimonas immobilis TaxID=728004 RepID=A0A840RXJ9_9BURK|nr:AraC family transcriptional regulator [Glaciimonas immobilis]KAF3996471.1 helix-turn-helix transcriptional regulator [Glaciimonas immobilis]MBB5201180.1 AraC-like DNA-binding protein [Glaciimonas immobilis]
MFNNSELILTPTPTRPTRPPRQRHIWINSDRVFYSGLIGQRTTRVMGSILMYVSLSEPIRISIDNGDWITTDFAVVQPYTPHRIECDNRLVAVMHIEPETVALEYLPAYLKSRSGKVADPELVQRIVDAYAKINRLGDIIDPKTEDFDMFFFGQLLVRPPPFESRIAMLVERIKENPCGQASAISCAADSGLSVSRFLHLFRATVGISFRSFRSWKRGRSLLYRLLDSNNLIYLALNTGYPDATHFSHSVRQVFGMTPTLLFKSSQSIRMYGQAIPPPHAL